MCIRDRTSQINRSARTSGKLETSTCQGHRLGLRRRRSDFRPRLIVQQHQRNSAERCRQLQNAIFSVCVVLSAAFCA
eukprot:2090223-Alexandrium_andersonii.AAC.1